MANKISPVLCLVLAVGLTCAIIRSGMASRENRKLYIVYMGDRPQGESSTSSRRHLRMLQNVISSNFSPEHLLHSYKRTFNGFVAKLSEDEAHKISRLPGVVSVFPDEKKELHTTRSWDFLEFPQQVQRSSVESDVIIGMIDLGIWPESDSFKADGLGPPPSKWKGSCHFSSEFHCNNKIIGATFYRSDGAFGSTDIRSPRDSKGHGTHTASIAAGGLVPMANLYGLAQGTARGGVPSARIAVYKVCWSDGCSDADILAAFDDAIADGVDIISISIGSLAVKNYFNDSIAIGAFHAMKAGILTSNSAGNYGPAFRTITNFSPWSLSVAASTIDRKFFTNVQLGNNKIYEGVSINTFDLKNAMFPIIYGGDAPNITGNFTSSDSRFCSENSLNSDLVKGKIVLCDTFDTGVVPLLAGAVGTIMQDNTSKDTAYSYPLPASYLSSEDGLSILSYINFTRNATATIYETHEGNDTLAPYVAQFSSRGPNPITVDILKPDIAAPGVDILAAWSLLGPMSKTPEDNRRVPYNIIAGTSMACPHATGVAAYVKSYHQTWSPAAIKSALMTTASPMSPEINPEAELAYGAGHINPVKAIDPGLIYDAGPTDYIEFLCGQGYNTSLLRMVTGDTSSCTQTINERDLNYPSFALYTKGNVNGVFNRVVTNVGSPNSTYKANVHSSGGLTIQVNPNILSFNSTGQKLSFTVTLGGSISVTIVSASLVWDDGVHQVRSPITVFT